MLALTKASGSGLGSGTRTRTGPPRISCADFWPGLERERPLEDFERGGFHERYARYEMPSSRFAGGPGVRRRLACGRCIGEALWWGSCQAGFAAAGFFVVLER